jgi:hypothetical protein
MAEVADLIRRGSPAVRPLPLHVRIMPDIEGRGATFGTDQDPTSGHHHPGRRWRPAVSKKGCASRLSYRKTLDASEYWQCARRSRNRPVPAGAGSEYRWACPDDQAGQFTVSRRTRYSLAGCTARGGAQLRQFLSIATPGGPGMLRRAFSCPRTERTHRARPRGPAGPLSTLSLRRQEPAAMRLQAEATPALSR